ncbi:MAG: threonine aldolase family protein [Actinomycetota bacterium]
MGSDAIARRLAELPPPTVTFASDNAAGVHPAVMEALEKANRGHAVAYGEDVWTRNLGDALRDRFGGPVEVLPVWGGTGANVVALACLVHASDAIVCTTNAHIHVDEAGAPERMSGAKVIAVDAADGKLHPEHLREHVAWLGDEHHPQPKVVSISQSTEVGTCYAIDEIAALCDEAHQHGMLVHVDGARIANATVALGGDLQRTTIDAGVDVISFGGTKNGTMYGETVVFCQPQLAARARHVRKQLAQLPSKARFISAQFLALLDGDLWLELAGHANAMTSLLAACVTDTPGLKVERAPVVNSLFAVLPPDTIEALQQWCFFYVWDAARGEVRWMTAWDTTPDDVEAFATGVRAALGATR